MSCWHFWRLRCARHILCTKCHIAAALFVLDLVEGLDAGEDGPDPDPQLVTYV